MFNGQYFFLQQTSQSLQLLFQLPNVQQTGAQSQSQAVLTTINQPVSRLIYIY